MSEEKKRMLESNVRLDKSSFEEWIIEKGEFMIQKTSIVKQFDRILQKWITIDEKVSILKPSECGYVKNLIVSLLIKRTATDMQTLKPFSKYFKIDLKVRIPDIEGTKWKFLKLVKGTYYRNRFDFGKVCLADAENGTCFPLDEDDKLYFERTKETPISIEKAFELVKNCEVLDIFEEDSQGHLMKTVFFHIVA